MLVKIRKRTILSVICTLVLSASLLSAGAAQADPFERTASGWINPTNVDVNGNGRTISVITTYGKGAFGTSVSNSTTEVNDPDPTQRFCSPPSPTNVVIRLPLLARSTVTRFHNGDLLFATLDLDPLVSSALCVDISNQTTLSEVHMVITGGTGKFAGATGTLLITTNGTQLHFEDGLNVHSGITEFTEGEIFLNHYDDDDNDD